jgi:hypothetical protein
MTSLFHKVTPASTFLNPAHKSLDLILEGALDELRSGNGSILGVSNIGWVRRSDSVVIIFCVADGVHTSFSVAAR